MSTQEMLKERAEYKYGFSTNIEMESFPKGLTEETIRQISSIKKEPAFLLEFRLKAFQNGSAWKNPTGPI